MSNDQLNQVALPVVQEPSTVPPQPPQEETPGEEVAATTFFLYYPKYVDYVEKMTGNQARRLLKALVGVPLYEKRYKNATPEEQEAFNIGDQLLQCKFVMMLKTLQESAMRAAEQKVSEENSDNKQENNGENNNAS